MTSRDPEIWMWAEACQMLERAERLHRQFFHLHPAPRRPGWEPPVDVFETQNALWILAALPGVIPAQISVGFDNGALIIAGERRLPGELRTARIHRFEIPHGRFERRIDLPAGHYEVDHKELTNGCLLLRLHKAR